MAALKKQAAKNMQWSLDGLVGLEKNQEQLNYLMTSGRMHPIMMLEGRQGLGKRHLAVWLAARFFCDVEDTQFSKAVPCLKCGSCKEILVGTHADVTILDGEGQSIKTAEAAVFQEHFNVLSSSGKRVGIIMNADRLTIEASNRLLKTLEEPPEQARIILTTSRPLALPRTILGRCLRWRVALPARDTVLTWADRVIKEKLGQEVSLSDVERIVKRFGYSPGKIQSKLDQSDALELMDQLDVRQLLTTNDLASVIKVASDMARNRKVKVSEILDDTELELCSIYREKLGVGHLADVCKSDRDNNQSWSSRHYLRQALSLARRQAIQNKTALNSQLVAESIGLSRWKES
jgi:DNA polymerase III gamma/tau subunit